MRDKTPREVHPGRYSLDVGPFMRSLGLKSPVAVTTCCWSIADLDGVIDES